MYLDMITITYTTHSLSADAVLSFANQATVVSEVMHTVGEFLLHWTRTPSSYDVLVSTTITTEWAARHRPVISKNGVHTLYTGFHITQPSGSCVICPGCNGVENRHWKVFGSGIKVKCFRCQSECFIPRVVCDAQDILERKGVCKTTFPQVRFNADWKFNGPVPESHRQAATKANRSLLVSPSAMRHIIPPSTSPCIFPPPPTMEQLLQFPPPDGHPAPGPDNNFAERPEVMDVDSPSSVVITSPPPSHSPSPSPTHVQVESVLKIHLPHRAKIRTPLHPTTTSTSQQTQQDQLLVAPLPIKRTCSAPEPEINVPTSLADITPLNISTDSKKRRKRH